MWFLSSAIVISVNSPLSKTSHTFWIDLKARILSKFLEVWKCQIKPLAFLDNIFWAIGSNRSYPLSYYKKNCCDFTNGIVYEVMKEVIGAGIMKLLQNEVRSKKIMLKTSVFKALGMLHAKHFRATLNLILFNIYLWPISSRSYRHSGTSTVCKESMIQDVNLKGFPDQSSKFLKQKQKAAQPNCFEGRAWSAYTKGYVMLLPVLPGPYGW